jgi:hypothetical protein
MPRLASLALVVCVLCPAPARPAEPTRAAPVYSLPDDGSWVEYDWTGAGPDGKEIKGLLRISAVGTKTTAGVTSRWVEVRKEYGRGDGAKREYRKFLLPVKAFADAPTLRDHVTSVIGQGGSEAPHTLSRTARRSFLELGLTGDEAGLKEVRAREKVEVPLGKYETREVRARGTAGERELEYRGWLSAEVPFGCARFEIYEGPAGGAAKKVFAASAARSGRDAKAELDETKAR